MLLADTVSNAWPTSYFNSSVLHVQYAINEALIRKAGANRVTGRLGAVEVWSFAAPLKNLLGASHMSVMIATFLALIMSFPMFSCIGLLIFESKPSMKEFLVACGMNVRNYILSWCIIFSAIALLLSAVVTLELYFLQMLNQSCGYFFLLSVSYLLCNSAMSLMVYNFLKTYGRIVIFCIFQPIILTMPYVLMQLLGKDAQFPLEYSAPFYVIGLLMISPNFAFSIGIEFVSVIT